MGNLGILPPRDGYKVWEGLAFAEQPHFRIFPGSTAGESYVQDCRGLGVDNWINADRLDEQAIEAARMQWRDSGVVSFDDFLSPEAAEYWFRFLWNIRDEFWKQCSNEIGTKKLSGHGKSRADTQALIEQRKQARV